MRELSDNPSHPPPRSAWWLATGAAALLALAATGFAEEYQAQATYRDDSNNPSWSWTLPHTWKNSANANGVPTTANDVGIISAGHHLTVGPPLGADGNRPTIRLEPGGTLSFLQDMVNPLELDGGAIDGMWFGKVMSGPIAMTADTTVHCTEDNSGPQFHLNGQITNTKPVTLRIDGSIGWHNDSSKTFSGTILIDRGIIHLFSPGTAQMGSGPIVLGSGARLVLQQPTANQGFVLNSQVFGNGDVQVVGGGPGAMLEVTGATLHPGLANQPGTMGINASVDFRRSAAGVPDQLIIEVPGNGSDPSADYGQLVALGNVTNSLDNLDVVLHLKPGITAVEAARLHLVVFAAANGADLIKPTVRRVHSVTVISGQRRGTATAANSLDSLTGQGIVEISDIKLK